MNNLTWNGNQHANGYWEKAQIRILVGISSNFVLRYGSFGRKSAIFEYIQYSNMRLNEYGIFEYSKNGHSLEALIKGRVKVNRLSYWNAGAATNLCNVCVFLSPIYLAWRMIQSKFRLPLSHSNSQSVPLLGTVLWSPWDFSLDSVAFERGGISMHERDDAAARRQGKGDQQMRVCWICRLWLPSPIYRIIAHLWMLSHRCLTCYLQVRNKL